VRAPHQSQSALLTVYRRQVEPHCHSPPPSAAILLSIYGLLLLASFTTTHLEACNSQIALASDSHCYHLDPSCNAHGLLQHRGPPFPASRQSTLHLLCYPNSHAPALECQISRYPHLLILRLAHYLCSGRDSKTSTWECRCHDATNFRSRYRAR
jgi:hypothetical protein